MKLNRGRKENPRRERKREEKELGRPSTTRPETAVCNIAHVNYKTSGGKRATMPHLNLEAGGWDERTLGGDTKKKHSFRTRNLKLERKEETFMPSKNVGGTKPHLAGRFG